MIGDIFADGGVLATALRQAGRSTRMRVSQREYANHVHAAQASGKPVFVDAETGVGKTLGYLIPTMLAAFASPAGRPLVVISTATVALQRQLLADDIPIAIAIVRDVLGVHAKAEIRVGRQQVIDPDRLENAISELSDAYEVQLAADVSAWVADRIAEGVMPLRADLMEAFSDRIAGHKTWLSMAVIGLLNADETSEVGDLYRRQVERCEEANVLVVNHHLLALNMLRPFLWSGDRSVHVIVDEADRLPGVVESLTRRVVPLHALASSIRGLPKMDAALEAINELSEEVMVHFGGAWHGPNGGVSPMSRLNSMERTMLSGRMKVAENALRACLVVANATEAGRNPEARERLAQIVRATRELGEINEELKDQGGNALLYFSPLRSYPGIASIRSGSARVIAKRLWTEPKFKVASLTFTSATLASMASSSDETDVKRAFAPFIADCGFNVADIPRECCALIAPHSFGEMSFVRPPLDAPRPFEDDDDDMGMTKLRQEAVDGWVRMIRAAASEGGRTLVLCPSHRDITAIGTALADMGDRLVAQKSGLPTNAAITRFLIRDDSVWISASAWEGVSLPGAIAHIVVPRLPIRPSSLEDNIVERYFSEHGAASRGRSVVFGRRMAEARRRLRQGIGRGIRAADDSVKVWLGDYRWPSTQQELDSEFRDQPATWSPTMLNAIPKRFRSKLEKSPRFA
ncbi:hypothetical protein OIU34_20590 [Pararhizobium sp. BT-229]|uniref:ATP-dependent DNA helicase n=1 Tax=Pararhizobium sp. BT-229 TaxID=2986923 RepID=UPI0021F7704F|nr:helicase C-terminal domain-containing protein [Pararhizobium sp. BT-229]MCV9964288.1 hypothetical protein [Pararhizobium sp. BT-229]